VGRNFWQIKAWEHADNLAVEVYRVTKTFPKEEVYGLVSQMRRSAVSVAANIAEGASRNSKKDFLHFLNIAQGSLVELEYYVHLIERLEYVSSAGAKDLCRLHKEAALTLNGFIKAVSERNSVTTRLRD
jgi:four helix bundle protein